MPATGYETKDAEIIADLEKQLADMKAALHSYLQDDATEAQRLEKQLAEREAQCAAMREALVECREWFRFDMHYGSKPHGKQAMSTMLHVIEAALSSDAGRDFVRETEPLAALREIRGNTDDRTLTDRLVEVQEFLRHGVWTEFEARIRADERRKWTQALLDAGKKRIIRPDLGETIPLEAYEQVAWNEAIEACERKMDEVIYGGITAHTRAELRKLKRGTP